MPRNATSPPHGAGSTRVAAGRRALFGALASGHRWLQHGARALSPAAPRPSPPQSRTLPSQAQLRPPAHAPRCSTAPAAPGGCDVRWAPWRTRRAGRRRRTARGPAASRRAGPPLARDAPTRSCALPAPPARTRVALLDIDICGPSIPKMMGLEGEQVHQSGSGWSPVYVEENLSVMSVGFLLSSPDDAVIWRGPKKNGLIKQFLRDVDWGEIDYLIIDTPPGTSDEHLSIVQYLGASHVDGAVIITTPQEVSLQDVRKEINFCHKVKLPIIGVVENMSGFICPK
eukprot:XP_027325324.1 cytosolic Fe-S cluster assembly factor NUBP1 isoform X4 [Anas platyrhynchos]